MVVKLFQLNIERGKRLDEILLYIKKEGFDILHFQEASGGKLQSQGRDCFAEIKGALGYEGEFEANVSMENEKESYFANATFFRKEFNVKKKEIIWLKEYREVKIPDLGPSEDIPRNVLSLTLEIEGKLLQSINCHLAWSPSPSDTPEKIRQGKIFYDYLKTVSIPFVLSGDFNVDRNSQIVRWIDTLGRNLSVEHNVVNTLNPRLHVAQELFPSGHAVDFVFVSQDFKVLDFKVVEKDLSDHLGLYTEIEL